MIIELKSNTNEIELGDAIVFDDGSIRIIVMTNKGYGTYDPKDSMIYDDASHSIKELIEEYNMNNTRIIKKRNLKIVEM